MLLQLQIIRDKINTIIVLTKYADLFLVQ